ncbi:molecular chaperone, partial [Pantoea agglomerans]
LPWCGAFLGKVEAHATTAFYRTLAMLSREAIQAMYNELLDSSEETPDA